MLNISPNYRIMLPFLMWWRYDLQFFFYVRYTKYRIHLSDLTLERSDSTFSSYLAGYSALNHMAQADSCSCGSHLLASYKFDLTGEGGII